MVAYRKRNSGKYSDQINPFTLLYLTLVISILVLCNILYKKWSHERNGWQIIAYLLFTASMEIKIREKPVLGTFSNKVEKSGMANNIWKKRLHDPFVDKIQVTHKTYQWRVMKFRVHWPYRQRHSSGHCKFICLVKKKNIWRKTPYKKYGTFRVT